MRINVHLVHHLFLVLLLLLLLLLLYVAEPKSDIPEDLTVKVTHTCIHSHTHSHLCNAVVINLCWICVVTFRVVTVTKVYKYLWQFELPQIGMNDWCISRSCLCRRGKLYPNPSPNIVLSGLLQYAFGKSVIHGKENLEKYNDKVF